MRAPEDAAIRGTNFVSVREHPEKHSRSSQESESASAEPDAGSSPQDEGTQTSDRQGRVIAPRATTRRSRRETIRISTSVPDGRAICKFDRSIELSLTANRENAGCCRSIPLRNIGRPDILASIR